MSAVLSAVGHGALGLRDGLRDFHAFLEETGSIKDITVELRPGMLVSNWSFDRSSTYVSNVSLEFDGVRRDIVTVRSLKDTGLVRAESLGLCRNTPGTYFYDPDDVLQDAFVWDSSRFDDGVVLYDQFTRLFVHLGDNSDPNQTQMLVAFAFYFSERGRIEATLGPEKLRNGGLEAWNGAELLQWTRVAPSGSATARSEGIVRDGSSAVELTYGSPGGVAFIAQGGLTMLNRRAYRLVGYYRTEPENTGCRAWLRVRSPADDTGVLQDGRDVTPSSWIPLVRTGGEWRRFAFDFRGWARRDDLEVAFGLGEPGGSAAGAGKAYFDGLSLRRIFRFEYYEPRIAAKSLPAVVTGGNDIYFGNKRIGVGSVSLANADGKLERLLASLEWLNHEAIVSTGGEFLDGQEILIDDMRPQLTGLIQDYGASDAEVALELQDARTFFHVQLPPGSYDDTTFPRMDMRQHGRSRPLLLGAKENITPVRVDLSAGYGVYEVCDTRLAPSGIQALTRVYAYARNDEVAVATRRADRRLLLQEGLHYSADLSRGWVTILKDVGPYVIDPKSNKLNFAVGVPELTATLTPGLYTAEQLALHARAQMSAVAGTTIAVAHDESTHRFSFSVAGGTLTLKTQSGSNADISAWAVMGVRRDGDKVGALSYVGEDPTFTGPDVDHVIRVDGEGYKDDGVGTYTGTPGATIRRGADIARLILHRYLKKDPSLVDNASFNQARVLAPDSLAILLKNPTSSQDIFERLELSNLANFIIDGRGRFFYRVYDGAVPAGTPELFERDILPGFRASRSVTDVYTTVSVKYDQDPSTDAYQTRGATDSTVELRFGRTEQRAFETYIKLGDNASSLAARLLTLAKRPARKLTVRTKSKLIDREVGDKVRITRRRALDPRGAITGNTFRIIGIRKSPQDAEVEADLVDDVVTVAGVACVATCQVVCESSDQSACRIACQTSCELTTCQTGCQVSCEGCGQTVCQETCQATCQGCGQTSCQATCEVTCQSTCEVSCQGCVQTTCQTGCQAQCQEACQTSCQGCGQASCQSTCETSCQGCKQTTCQTVCQTGCQGCSQTTCEETCQTSCQGCGQTTCQEACQSACQTTCQVACEETCQQECQSVQEQPPI